MYKLRKIILFVSFVTLFQRRDMNSSQQYTVLISGFLKATFLLDGKNLNKKKKKKTFNKSIRKERLRFILEERSSDEQEERTKGPALNSLGSSTVRMSKHSCVPWQSLCKDAGLAQKIQHTQLAVSVCRFLLRDNYINCISQPIQGSKFFHSESASHSVGVYSRANESICSTNVRDRLHMAKSDGITKCMNKPRIL